MKKALLTLSALLLTGAAHAADPAFPKAPAGNVSLEVWSWVPGLDKTVTAFTKAYPNIKVKVVNLGGGAQTYTKLLTTLKAGTGAPDVPDGAVDLRGGDAEVDVVVVGLGITGAGVALDAVTRGLTVLAVDAHDERLLLLFNLRSGATEVVACGDLTARLIEGVLQLLAVKV